MGERIQASLYAGYHWPASKTPFKRRFAGVSLMAQNRMLVGSFVILKGTGPVC